MGAYDIFNGDADGLFALRQLRLHEPRDAVLVTGVKRDITLMERVRASAGDELTVLDISLAQNRQGLMAALAAGARCRYFDHHFPGDIPVHPGLEAHIRHCPDTCTSLIVDEYLQGRYRPWAVAAAFGDNLPQVGRSLGIASGLSVAQVSALDELGRLVNYNAYGRCVEDLHFPPAQLYMRLTAYADPLEFAARDPVLDRLRRAYEQDLHLARSVTPAVNTDRHIALLLPDASWSRRVSGSIANELAQQDATRASAVIVAQEGAYVVSIRAPAARPTGAGALAARFRSGGGRPGAAGINRLSEDDLPRFLESFQRAFTAAAD